MLAQLLLNLNDIYFIKYRNILLDPELKQDLYLSMNNSLPKYGK